MAPFDPKVSIIIPVYNGANYLGAAIESALSQTYRNIEIVVVNDGSSDGGNTEAVALSFGDRVRYFSKANGGVSSALNLGIEKATGEYISWLSHDDMYRPEKVHTQVDYLRHCEIREHVVVYSNYTTLVVKSGQVIETRLRFLPPESFRYRVAVENTLHGCTMLIPKAAFVQCGLFSEQLRAVQDYDMWFRMGERYRFVHIPQSLVIGRVHSEQVGVKLSSRARQESIAFRRQCLEQLTLDEITSATGKSASLSLVKIFEIFAARGLFSAAWGALFLSLRSLKHDGIINALIYFPQLCISFCKGACFALYLSARRVAAGLRY